MASGIDKGSLETPVVGRGRARGFYFLKGEEVKKLSFSDILGVGGDMDTHPVGSTFYPQTPHPYNSDGEGHMPVKVGEAVTPAVGPTSSTPILPSSSNDPTAELRDLITELGNRIGDSIASRLFTTTQPISPTRDTVSPVVADRHDHPSSISNTLDLTKVNVVVKLDVCEPAVFRGEESDKCTVQEWIELMEVYLRKKNCPARSN